MQLERPHVAAAVQSWLDTVRDSVRRIVDPGTGKPVEVPDFAAIRDAAGRLDTCRDPNSVMWVTNSLLQRAASVDLDVPDAAYKVRFPADHHLHATMGTEWYWIGCHMKVVDSHGNAGRLSLLQSMQKIRIVGLAAQRAAGWSDKDVTLATDIVTVTVDMGPGRRGYHRRSRILQNPLTGGVVDFSVPGQAFFFRCGPDRLSGSADVLPLRLEVDDGDNMRVDLTFTHDASIDLAHAFFLQGVPTAKIDGGGTGVTPNPSPGIYYSWPQLPASGTVRVGGETYTVQSGRAWIDHQLLMTSLDPHDKDHVPFVDDPRPFKGWTWQFYHLDNGHAFTGAAFVNGPMTPRPSMSYGYYLAPKDRGWAAIYITGDNDLLAVDSFGSFADGRKSARANVDIPTVRTYRNVKNVVLGDALWGVATPWYRESTFNNPNWGICSEAPADYTDLSGKHPNGLGYLETVGFEPVAAYRAFALAFIRDPFD
jgi:hypothetical protein